MTPRQGVRIMAVVFALLVTTTIVSAQVNYDVRPVAVAGDPVQIPAALSRASRPSLNARGEVAFEGDSAILLKSANQLTVVAGYGDPAPGGGTFTSSYGASMNGKAEVAFVGGVSAAGKQGIYLFSSEMGLRRIVVAGDPVPGGGTFDVADSPAINDAGDVAFRGFGGSGYALFLYSEGTITRLARIGDPAPGGGIFNGIFYNAINSNGQVVFIAALQAGGNGIYLASGGTLTKIVRPGDSAPEGIFQQIFPTPIGLNDAGDVAFTGSDGRAGIFLYSGGQVRALVRDGDPAPGGGNLSFPRSASLNNSGQIAFQASLAPSRNGVFLYSRGSVTKIMVSGDASPDGDFFQEVAASALNDTGEVAFQAHGREHLDGIYLFSEGQLSRVAGQGDAVDRDPMVVGASTLAINAAGTVLVNTFAFPGGRGVFDDTLTPIAREGDPAPGGGAFSTVGPYAFTSVGDILLYSSLTTSQSGLFLYSGGGLNQIVRSGDPAPGGSTFNFLSNPSMNDLQQVAFVVFTDPFPSGGLYVASGGSITRLVELPSPAPGGGNFISLSATSISDDGNVVFYGEVFPNGRSGIFQWSQDTVTPIVRDGDSAPARGTFRMGNGAPFVRPVMNAAGQIAFQSLLSDNSSGVFLYSAGQIIMVAHSNDPAPGGGTFTQFESVTISDAGQVVFTGYFQDFSTGIFSYSGSALGKVIRSGDPAPEGDAFGSVTLPAVNSEGLVAFTGRFSSGFGGVYLATPK